MNYMIETIRHSQQNYATYGDYRYDEHGGHVWVSDFSNEDIEFIIMIHELIEMYITKKRGIKEEDITAFDMAHPELDEPGRDSGACYHREHMFCEAIEILLCDQLGIDYNDYQNAEPLEDKP